MAVEPHVRWHGEAIAALILGSMASHFAEEVKDLFDDFGADA